MHDINPREWLAITPLLVLMVWMGIGTQTFLPWIGAANAKVLEQTKVNVEFRVSAPAAGPEVAVVH
jgi:NADH-quinone oxidoreductase subunit M